MGLQTIHNFKRYLMSMFIEPIGTHKSSITHVIWIIPLVSETASLIYADRIMVIGGASSYKSSCVSLPIRHKLGEKIFERNSSLPAENAFGECFITSTQFGCPDGSPMQLVGLTPAKDTLVNLLKLTSAPSLTCIH